MFNAIIYSSYKKKNTTIYSSIYKLDHNRCPLITTITPRDWFSGFLKPHDIYENQILSSKPFDSILGHSHGIYSSL